MVEVSLNPLPYHLQNAAITKQQNRIRSIHKMFTEEGRAQKKLENQEE